MVIRVVGSQLEVDLQVPLNLERSGAMGDSVPDVLQCSTSSPSSSSTPKFLEQWRSITSKRFVLNMVKGHNPQLKCCPMLFHNFRQFNIKGAAAHHPII